MPEFLPDELQNLTTLPISELRQLANTLRLKKPINGSKTLLIRDISWHLQARALGGLPLDAKALLKSAIKRTPLQKSQVTANVTNLKPQRLKEGTVLSRQWNNKTHTVTVVKNGRRFMYKQTEYRSLSKIAKLITGAHWSGPRFFGLSKLKTLNG